LLAAAVRLRQGLALPQREVPADMADRVLAAWKKDRRPSWRRVAAWAAAAAVVLAAGIWIWQWQRGPGRPEGIVQQPTSPPPPLPDTSPSRQFAQAGDATLNLTRRAAAETLDSFAMLFPRLPETAIPTPRPPTPTLPLNEIGRSVNYAFDPVTESAARAWNHFVSKLPPGSR
jgi:hypothetical protein